MPDISVNLVQFDIAWQNPKKNRSQIEKLLESGKNCDLIVLPETFTTGFTIDCMDLAEKMDGETLSWMKKLASEKRAVVTGSLFIEDEGSFYNRLIWMRPDGTYEFYNKRHLFRMAGEDENLTEGNRKIFPVLKGWRICPLICYDLRFPVWSRNQNDYDLLIYVANWPELRSEAWKVLVQARAIENLSPVIAVNRVGQDGKGMTYTGDSLVFDAQGNKLNKLLEPKKSGIERVVLKIDEMKKFREKFPTFLDADSFAIQE